MNQENKTVFDTDFVSIFGTKISSLYKDAVEYQQVLPDLTLARFRQILELWCADLAKKNSLYGVEELSLCEFINFLYSEHVFNRDVKDKLHTIRQLANTAVHANKDMSHDRQRGELRGATIKAKSILCSLFKDVAILFGINRSIETIVEGMVKGAESKEIIYKALLSDKAKDKFLGAKAIDAIRDEYSRTLPPIANDYQNVHVLCCDDLALHLYLAAIELDAELDKISVSYWSEKSERIKLVHSRSKPEYNYEFALLVADRSDDDIYKQRARIALQAASDKKHLPSQALLGAILYEEKKFENVLALLNRPSIEGDLIALRTLYFYYSEGKACAPDIALATDYAEKAIELGCTQTMLAYGQDLIKGNNVVASNEKGIELIQRAARQGNKQADMYSKVFIENDISQVLLDGFNALLKSMDQASISKNVAGRGNKNKVGVNDKCPCGSGKKYKHCCRV